MRPALTRRSMLASSVGALVPALAGCSGDETSTPDPDEGKESYGILLTNDFESEQTVRMKVVIPWEDVDPVFEEEVTVDAGGSREWDRVITEPKEQSVVAKIGEGTRDREVDNVWVTPGAEHAPPDPNVRIDVGTITHERIGPRPDVSVYFESERED